MADLDLGAQQIVLNAVATELPGFISDDMEVTVTATMKNGSLLIAAGTEAATADAANVVGVVDSLMFRGDVMPEVGETITVAVFKRGCCFKEANVVFTDGAINAAAKAALATSLNTFA